MSRWTATAEHCIVTQLALTWCEGRSAAACPAVETAQQGIEACRAISLGFKAADARCKGAASNSAPPQVLQLLSGPVRCAGAAVAAGSFSSCLALLLALGILPRRLAQLWRCSFCLWHPRALGYVLLGLHRILKGRAGHTPAHCLGREGGPGARTMEPLDTYMGCSSCGM